MSVGVYYISRYGSAIGPLCLSNNTVYCTCVNNMFSQLQQYFVSDAPRNQTCYVLSVDCMIILYLYDMTDVWIMTLLLNFLEQRSITHC